MSPRRYGERYEDARHGNCSIAKSRDGDEEAVMATKTIDFGGGGRRYEGEVNAAGLPHGAGVLATKDGWRYEGEFRDGVPHGQGVKTVPDGTRYEGGFRNDVLHGQGVMTWPDWERNEGEWRHGVLHGQGVVTCPDGERYEGEFWDGELHGQGVLTWPDRAVPGRAVGRGRTRSARGRAVSGFGVRRRRRGAGYPRIPSERDGAHLRGAVRG